MVGGPGKDCVRALVKFQTAHETAND